jgi:hypothetical protein
MATKQKVGLPSKNEIRTYWSHRLVLEGKFLSPDELFEGDVCFACAMDNSDYTGPTHKAHIMAKCSGGPPTLDNLHVLCKACHLDSEFLEGKAYWNWFHKRTAMAGIMSTMMLIHEGRRAICLWLQRQGYPALN